MTDLSQYYVALRNADAAGDTAAATRLTDFIKQQQAPAPIATQEPQLGPRQKQLFDIRMSQAKGETGPIHGGLQQAGVAAGAIGDVAVDAAKGAFHMLPEVIQKPIAGAGALIGAGVQAAGKLPAIGGGTIGERIPQELAANPNLARDLSAVSNIAALVPGGMAGKGAAGAIGDVAKVVKTEAPISSESARQMAKPFFDKSKDLGGVLHPDVTKQWIAHIEDIAPKTTREIEGGQNAVSQYKDLAQKELSGHPLSLEQVENIDKELRSRIYSTKNMLPNGKMTDEGRQLLLIQQKLRELAFNAAQKDTIGNNAQAFQAWQQGQKIWANHYKLADIEAIMKRAELSDNPQSVIKRGFASLYNNAKKSKNYTPDEKNQLKKAGSTGVATSVFNFFGNRIVDTLGGLHAGGIPGAIAANAVGKGAREVAGKLQAIPARRLQSDISANIRDIAAEPPVRTKYIEGQPQALLPPPDKMSRLPMTDRQIAIARAHNRYLGGRPMPETPYTIYGRQQALSGAMRRALLMGDHETAMKLRYMLMTGQ